MACFLVDWFWLKQKIYDDFLFRVLNQNWDISHYRTIITPGTPRQFIGPWTAPPLRSPWEFMIDRHDIIKCCHSFCTLKHGCYNALQKTEFDVDRYPFKHLDNRHNIKNSNVILWELNQPHKKLALLCHWVNGDVSKSLVLKCITLSKAWILH